MIVKLIDYSGHNCDADGDGTKYETQQQRHIHTAIITGIAWISNLEVVIVWLVAVGAYWSFITDGTGALIRRADVV